MLYYSRWLGICLDGLAGVIVFLASLFAVIQRGSLSAGLAGLSVTFSMQVNTKCTIVNVAVQHT